MLDDKNNASRSLTAKKAIDGERTLKPYVDSDCVLIRMEDAVIWRNDKYAFLFRSDFFNEESNYYGSPPYLTAPNGLSDEQIMAILRDLNNAYKEGYQDRLIVGEVFWEHGYKNPSENQINLPRRADGRILKPYVDANCVLIQTENIGIERYDGKAFVFDYACFNRRAGSYAIAPYLTVPDSVSDEQILEIIIRDLNGAYKQGYEDCLVEIHNRKYAKDRL
jgi:hypothetical protein